MAALRVGSRRLLRHGENAVLAASLGRLTRVVARAFERTDIAPPFLLVNPNAGDETPTAAELTTAARERGVEVRELRPNDDPTELARAAADRGAEAVGIAGGDGSLAAVATVALERDVPLVVVPFGTENHFARDLGLDRDDPLTAVAAFQGPERRVDIGLVGELPFLNNVSLGLYASMVHDPEHERRNRVVAFLRLLPALLGRSRRPLDILFEVDSRRERRRALAVLVANNDYRSHAPTGLAQRLRLDEGLLHVYVLEAVGRRSLVSLFARAAVGRVAEAEGWHEWSAASFTVEARRPRIHVAIDGEAAVLAPPLEFRIAPRALRVRLPEAVAAPGKADDADGHERSGGQKPT